MVTASNSCHLMLGDKLRWGMTPEELAARMADDRFEPNAAMAAGTHFEIPNMGWLSFLTGLAVEPDGRLWHDPAMPHMGASPDGWLSNPETWEIHTPLEDCPLSLYDEWGDLHSGPDAVYLLWNMLDEDRSRILLEMKNTTSSKRSTRNKPEPLDYYANQVQHQMHVLGEKRGILLSRVDSYELHGHVLTYDRAYCEELDSRCKAFHKEYL